MKLASVRFTVRWLMIAVLAVAALLGAFEAGRRWEREQDSISVRKVLNAAAWETSNHDAPK